MANILIVEDEKNMQDIIAEYMQRGGHTCFTADDGIDALMILKNNPMDLMILDIMMPNLDGFSVCKVAREMSSFPIIMLTAKGSEEDKLKGYDMGADDYLAKPFKTKELVARIMAIVRRPATMKDNRLVYGDLVFDLDNNELNGEALTAKEAGIIVELLKTPEKLVRKDYLLSKVWGGENLTEDNYIEVYMSHLRKKMKSLKCKTKIVTTRGFGYKIVAE